MNRDRRALLLSVAALAAAGSLPAAVAAPAGTLRVGVLKFGTVAWLLDVIAANGLDEREGIRLEPIDLATNQSGTIALLAGEVDLIVSDWPWALRQRAEGEDFRFAPYSAALGGVMVPNGSSIRIVDDLVGKRIGVAGSVIDKSWIMLRALARQTTGKDLARAATVVYGAPPLINEELKAGRLDAVLTYWNFAARLAGAGYHRAIDMAEVQKALGLDPAPPMVGFVWREALAAAMPDAIPGFFRAVHAANELLGRSDAEWARIRPLMRVETDAEFEAVKAFYRSGIPDPWTAAETRSAEKLFALLAELGGAELVGARTKFDAAVFAPRGG